MAIKCTLGGVKWRKDNRERRRMARRPFPSLQRLSGKFCWIDKERGGRRGESLVDTEATRHYEAGLREIAEILSHPILKSPKFPLCRARNLTLHNVKANCWTRAMPEPPRHEPSANPVARARPRLSLPPSRRAAEFPTSKIVNGWRLESAAACIRNFSENFMQVILALFLVQANITLPTGYTVDRENRAYRVRDVGPSDTS